MANDRARDARRRRLPGFEMNRRMNASADKPAV